ncbi:hypothetical protein ANAPC2_00692 [Anaplasma phagocytophilum]|nr:hypothetical protein ANAPC2_00692 [Anaplasma phagocytophilum]
MSLIVGAAVLMIVSVSGFCEALYLSVVPFVGRVLPVIGG